jgi:hypothetical protein
MKETDLHHELKMEVEIIFRSQEKCILPLGRENILHLGNSVLSLGCAYGSASGKEYLIPSLG